jgi:quercetin dioxygenase-like cupin family protein
MRTLMFSVLLFFASALSSSAEAPQPPQLPNFADTPSEWSAVGVTGGAGGSGNAKVQVVTLLGDPEKPGPYSQLLKVGPNASIAAHHHAGDRVGTVLKGTWHFGYGSEFDNAKLKELPVGSIYTEPSGAPHFAMTGDEPVVVLITGNGPTDTIYEDPANDPTKSAGSR